MTTATASPPRVPRRPAPVDCSLPQSAPPKPKPKSLVLAAPAARTTGHRAVVYGPGGIGKTTLAASAPGPVAVFDLDDSLPVLAPKLAGVNVLAVGGIESWQALRDALNGDGWDDVRTIVVDSITAAEELAARHTLATVPHEKGGAVKRIEDYGYGKGYTHVYETFLTLLGDLDRHVRAGRNVVLVCHDCTATVPNPQGEDYIRYEPRLQSPASGKASIRLRVREWADHVLFLGYDLDVKDGKAKGSGTRTVYPVELPHCMAKSRTLSEALPLDLGAGVALWTRLLGGVETEKESE